MRRPDNTRNSQEMRELAAVDAALAGEPVEPDLAELALLATDLREERPLPSGSFAESLDRRMAAGFAPSPRPRRRRRLLLAPAAGLASAAVIAVGIAVSLQAGGDDESGGGGSTAAPAVANRSRSGDESAPGSAPIPPPQGIAPLRAGGERKVERSASLVLTAPGDEIDQVSDRVVRVTDGVGGFVASSSVSSGDDGGGGATFELRVPSRRLGAALAQLSELAHVRSRSQNAVDVTAPYVSARERLQEARAERASLLRQLARADTPNEAASIRARLRNVASRIAVARGDFRSVRNRANLSTISLSLRPEDGQEGGAGPWTPGDAARDALRILSVALGVAVVTLAIALPFALLGLLAWGAGRAARRRRREAALDAA